jgi:capsular exopolysaccharide synthesis family protein
VDVDERAAPRTDVRRLAKVLWRRKWWVFLTLDVVVLGGLGLTLRQEDVYSAVAYVRLPETGSALQLGGGTAEEINRELATQQRLVTSPDVRDLVREEMGDSYALVGDVNAGIITDTLLLFVAAESTDPVAAQQAANSYARNYTTVQETQAVTRLQERSQLLTDQALEQERQADDLTDDIDVLTADIADETSRVGALTTRETNGTITDGEATELGQLRAAVAPVQAQIDELNQTKAGYLANATSYRNTAAQFDLEANFAAANASQVVSTASTPTEPISSGSKRQIIVFAFLGMLLGVGVALGREYLDDSIHDADDLQIDPDRLPVIGSIAGTGRRNRARQLVSVGPDDPVVGEAYRSLRTSIEFAALDRPTQVLLITSAGAGEGKSTTIANLGAVLAAAGSRVIVMCCDLRRPQIHEFFGLSNDVGVTSVLLGTHTLEQAIQTVELPGGYRLDVLASGPLPPNPSEVLGSARTGQLVDELRERADYVLVDPPPVVVVTDAVVASRWVDAIICVARTAVTSRRLFDQMLRTLERTGIPILGVVMNGTTTERRARRAGYHYAAEKAESAAWSGIITHPDGSRASSTPHTAPTPQPSPVPRPAAAAPASGPPTTPRPAPAAPAPTPGGAAAAQSTTKLTPVPAPTPSADRPAPPANTQPGPPRTPGGANRATLPAPSGRPPGGDPSKPGSDAGSGSAASSGKRR